MRNWLTYSSSMGCKLSVAMTKECSGGPKSTFVISTKEQAIIFWSSAPIRARPMHKVSSFKTRKKKKKKTLSRWF